MKHVVRHYVEMVIAMFVGMAVLGLPLRRRVGLARAGTSAPAHRLSAWR